MCALAEDHYGPDGPDRSPPWFMRDVKSRSDVPGVPRERNRFLEPAILPIGLARENPRSVRLVGRERPSGQNRPAKKAGAEQTKTQEPTARM